MSAQIATGSYPYGTYDSKGVETFNVGNLNMHLSIPVFQKAGRGLPFFYNLGYDSSVWTPVVVGGTTTWQPAQNFGWLAQTVVTTGYVSYSRITYVCDLPLPQHGSYTVYSGFVYHDPYGTSHAFDGQTEYDPMKCGDGSSSSLSSQTNDGSGLFLDISAPATPSSAKITNPSGATFSVPFNNSSGGTITDTNGNQVSVSSSGVFTDTLGKAALTVSGTAPNPVTLTYPITGNATATYTVKYSSFTVRTNFGCSGVVEYNAANSLISEIDLPNATRYLFSYEPTPGVPGNVTGRLATVTLPTGGQIAYTYSGGSNGILCADGGNATVKRVLTNDPAASTWSYARTPGNGISHTEVTDGLGNQSEYDFVSATGARVTGWYETNRAVYQGARGATLKSARQTCYDGAAAPCTTANFALPVTQVDVYDTPDGTKQRRTKQKYNSFGLQTEQDNYDYGTATTFGPLLSQQTWNYPTSGIVNLLSYTYIYDGAGHIISGNAYFYDEAAPAATSGLPQHVSVGGQRGNLTSSSQVGVNGGAPTATYTYDDAGQVLTAKDQALHQTTISYDTGTDALPVKVTLPTPSSGVALATSATYDLSTGLPLSTADANAQTSTYKAYDSLNRLTELDFPNGGKTSIAFPSVNQTSVKQFQNSTTAQDTEVHYDAYGRQDRAAVFNGQSGNPWYQSDSCFDGMAASASNPLPTRDPGSFRRSHAPGAEPATATMRWGGLRESPVLTDRASAIATRVERRW